MGTTFKNFFWFREKFVSYSWDIQVSVSLTIPWFTKSVMPWWILEHKTGCIFKYIFWTATHWPTKLDQLINMNKGNIFLESLEQFGGLGLSSNQFQILNNQKCQVFHVFYIYIYILYFSIFRIQKKSAKCNFHYTAMSIMTSQILKDVDFTKIQKSRYLKNEPLLFLQIKKINYTSRTILCQKILL